MGEGPDPDRPLSSLEKLHLIAGHALARKDIRHDHKQLLDVLNYSLSVSFFSCFPSAAGMKFIVRSASSW